MNGQLERKVLMLLSRGLAKNKDTYSGSMVEATEG